MIGLPLKMHGEILYQIQVIELNLHQIYFYLLLVSAVTVRLSTFRVTTVTTGLLLLTLRMPIAPTASTSIRPISILRTTTTVLTGTRCVVLRVPQILHLSHYMQMDELEQ